MAQNENNKIIFAPRPEYLGCELNPNITLDGNRITGEVVFKFRMPNPKRCAVLTNFTLPSYDDKARTE